MKAVGKYIVIKTISEESKMGGLLVSSEEANTLRYKKGRVVNPGTDVSTVKDGDLIYYDKSAGHRMIIDGEQYTVIVERDVVVVL